MKTIREIIRDYAQNPAYMPYVEPMVQALEDREESIKARLHGFGVGLGWSEDEIAGLFVFLELKQPDFK